MDKKISMETLSSLAENIIQLFPNKYKDTYYISYKKDGNKVAQIMVNYGINIVICEKLLDN